MRLTTKNSSSVSSKPVVFMFSGQGSQYYQMGRELYTKLEVFRRYLDDLDEMVIKKLDKSIVGVLYDSSKTKADNFEDTEDTTLAILMLEVALCRTLMELGIHPYYVLGSSLGELAAALFSEMLDFKTLLHNCLPRLIDLEHDTEKAAMIGIVNHVSLFDNYLELNRLAEIAALNFESHFVITCRYEHLPVVETFLKTMNIPHQILPVPVGYHSSLVDSAKPRFMRKIESIHLNPPTIPFFSCAYAREVTKGSPTFLWDIFRRPICFQETIRLMEKKQAYNYVDVGPTGTLAYFVKNNLSEDSDSDVFSILNPFGRDLHNLEHFLGYFENHSIKAKDENISISRSGFSD